MGSKYSNNIKQPKKKRFFKRRWLVYFLLFCFILCIIAYFVAVAIMAPYKERADTYDLSKIDDVEVKSLILDRKGREIGRFFVENRDKIGIDDMPEGIIDALIAGEDQRFFKHDGVDRVGVARAIYLNIQAGRNTQGASTITQQLARNAFHLKEEALKKDEGGLERKAVEAFLAMRIEKEYSKRQILEFYLNRVAFGSGYYGIRSAALGYFGKEPRDLTLLECCSLVGCIKNPTRISPLNSLEENKAARNQVLTRLIAEEKLDPHEGEALKLEPVTLNPNPIRRGTSHLYDRIGTDVRKVLGEEAFSEGGYIIRTTIDLDVQNTMEQSLLNQLAKIEKREGYEHPLYTDFNKADGRPQYIQGAGLMLDNSNGSVIAYVGGRDFTHSQYDFVRSGRKPIGTAFLPIVYTAALEQNKLLTSTLNDRPMDNRSIMIDGREGILGEWGMETYAPEYEGDISLRRGLEASKIAASVRLGSDVGLANVTGMASRLGIDMSETKLLPRLLVGTDDVSINDLVKAYSVFPNQGKDLGNSYFIDRIIDSKGTLRYQVNKDTAHKEVIKPQTAYLMHSILQGALVNGAGLENPLDQSMAGKTGTTYNFSDNWFVGYNGSVTCALWTGFLDGGKKAIYEGAFSKDTLLPPWTAVMNKATQKLPSKEIATPKGITTMEICKDSGLRKTRYCQDVIRNEITGEETYQTTSYKEYFLKNAVPNSFCDFHSMIHISTNENDHSGTFNKKLANSYTIPIQPKKPLLLGRDPYGSLQPDFAPKDKQIFRGSSYDMSFDQLQEQDKRASITLERPARISIQED